MFREIKSYMTNNSAEFFKYLTTSAFALSIDYASYWLLVSYKISSLPVSAATGYTIGLVVSYYLNISKVFKDGWLQDKKHYEIFFYATSGLLGWLLTYFTVKTIVLNFGDRIHLAKAGAVIVSFIGVYIFRKKFIFKKKHK